jgi:hypothetical protein
MTVQPIPLSPEGIAKLRVVFPPVENRVAPYAMAEVTVPEPAPGQEATYVQLPRILADRRLREGLDVDAHLKDGILLSGVATLDQLNIAVVEPEPEEPAILDATSYRPLSSWE